MSRRALAGFVVSGLLLAFPGAILPAWGYHIRPHYLTVGNYFLSVNVGMLASFLLAPLLIRRSVTGALSVACVLAALAMLSLSLTSPPVAEVWRLPGLLGLGCAAGMLHTAIFHAISGPYQVSRIGTVNLAGVCFGMGSCVTPLLLAGVFHAYTVGATLLLFATILAGFAVVFARTRLTLASSGRQRTPPGAMREFRSASAILLSLLLFFQFGNEWSIALWLPLFLVQRVGLSPSVALLMLVLYWLALVAGRLAAQAILPNVSRARLLLSGVVGALFGCLVLTFTNNLFGSVLGTLLVGFGFAPIYPLVVEKIGNRFPNYHPGYFNGIFSVALTGGMLAPATLGYLAEFFGLGVVMALPALGAFIVLMLVLVIWLEAKMAGVSEA